MRSQWCREHIDETALNCGLSPDTVSECEQAAKFCDEHAEYSDCSTMAILTLIRVRDDPVRDKAISSIEKSLESGKHPLTGAIIKSKKLTVPEIKKVIQKVEMEVRGEIVKKIKQEKKSEPLVLPPPDPEPPARASEPAPIVPAAHVPAPVLTQAKMVTAPVISGDPEKQKRAERNFHADELLERMPSSTKVMVTEIINEHRDWKVADVFYYGIQALAESKKKR